MPAWAENLARRLEEQRGRMRAAVEGHRQKAREWETSLQAQLASIQQLLQAGAQETSQRDADLTARLTELKSEEKRLTAQDDDVATRRGELEAIRQSLEAAHESQLARQQAILDEVTRGLAELHQREAAAASLQAAAAAAHAEAEAIRQACSDCERLLLEREEALKQRDAELTKQTMGVQQREQTLSDREVKLRDREAAFERREASVTERAVAIQKREESLNEREETLRGHEEMLRERSDKLRDAERAATERETHLAREAEKIKLDQQRTRSQRTAAAHELRARRKELLAEAERSRAAALQAAAGDETALGLQLADAKLEITQLRAAEETHAHAQLVLEEKVESTKRELLELQDRLSDAESRVGNAAEPGGETEDLRQRLEMALADMRDLKQRNSELVEDLARSKSSASVPGIPGGGGLDWESRKQQLLAQLESDFDAGDPQQKANKLTVEAAIQRTEEIVSAKNEEISELQRLLSEQSGNIGGVAIGAAAIAEMLDTDELVRQERENLREMQERLREQLKQAEIDLSVERAKIARERSVLEEKMRQYEDHKQSQAAAPEDGADKSKKGSNRGRWLQRLGLRDDEQK